MPVGLQGARLSGVHPETAAGGWGAAFPVPPVLRGTVAVRAWGSEPEVEG